MFLTFSFVFDFAVLSCFLAGSTIITSSFQICSIVPAAEQHDFEFQIPFLLHLKASIIQPKRIGRGFSPRHHSLPLHHSSQAFVQLT
jgi:hypothetical protein